MHDYESGNLVPLTLLGRGGLLVVSVLYTFFSSPGFYFVLEINVAGYSREPQ